MTPASEKSIDRARQWLLNNNKHLDDIPSDLDIVANRLIDSLQFVGFVLYIEELRGRPIPERDVNVDSFRTLENIRERFFTGQ
jgi:hypothetical protein